MYMTALEIIAGIYFQDKKLLWTCRKTLVTLIRKNEDNSEKSKAFWGIYLQELTS